MKTGPWLNDIQTTLVSFLLIFSLSKTGNKTKKSRGYVLVLTKILRKELAKQLSLAKQHFENTLKPLTEIIFLS